MVEAKDARGFIRRLLALVVGCGLGWASGAAAQPQAQPHAAAEATPVVLDILSPPWAFAGSDGRRHLVYELRMSNATPEAIRLTGVDVINAQTQQPIAVFPAGAIATRFAIGADRNAMADVLAAHQFGIFYVHAAVDPGAPAPAWVRHRVALSFVPSGPAMTVEDAPAEVILATPPVLGPPLRGHNYIAGDGCCDSIRHVRALLPLNAQFMLAQRFAIDWEQLDDSNRIFVGDAGNVHSYRIYGQEVLAVGDGEVVASASSEPDQPPGRLPQNMPLEKAHGNFVLQDLGRSAYALYAHLAPNSVHVQPGAMLRKGQVIGRVGNSGNTQAPHLHFHIVDAPSPLAADGLPYVFERFAISGVDRAGTADFDRAEATGAPATITRLPTPTPHAEQLPLDLSVVDWLNGAP
jgi:hypothetical protein